MAVYMKNVVEFLMSQFSGQIQIWEEKYQWKQADEQSQNIFTNKNLKSCSRKNEVDTIIIKYSPTIKSQNQLPAERLGKNTM